MKRGGGDFVQDGVCLVLRLTQKIVERAEAAKPVERLLRRALVELFSGEWLACFLQCVRERLCKDVILALDWNVGTVIINLGLIS